MRQKSFLHAAVMFCLMFSACVVFDSDHAERRRAIRLFADFYLSYKYIRKPHTCKGVYSANKEMQMREQDQRMYIGVSVWGKKFIDKLIEFQTSV